MDAAASSSPVWCFVFMFLYLFFCLLVNICEANYVYSRQDLIDFGPYIKTIKICPEGALSQLQDCFGHTVWDIFEQQDLEEYTGTVLSYINHCTDTVTAAKRIRVYPNQKPWMTSKVKTLLQERNSASGQVTRPFTVLLEPT